ncbi:MAG: cytochrome c [Pseudomonadota bacterium]
MNTLLECLRSAQAALLELLHLLGWAPDVDGQPGWPFGRRIAGETLMLDIGQARQLVVCLLLVAAALLLLVAAACCWRRGWPKVAWPLAAATVATLALAPWPSEYALWTRAYPTSFHTSPTGFSADSVVRGRTLFQQQCVSCHGGDGRGQGPLARQLAMWPPDLSSPLLWRRADGELLWVILHGKSDRQGTETMPGFQARLDVQGAWALIDYMRALAAGQALQASGAWVQPVRVPKFSLDCERRGHLSSTDLRGQRLLILAPERNAPDVLPDPRMLTVELVLPGRPAQTGSADCVADTPDAREALALIAGRDARAFGGAQFIADRGGWLRAFSPLGKETWSASDLLCRSNDKPGGGVAAQAMDALSSLIAEMDAEPVRFVQGGFVH